MPFHVMEEMWLPDLQVSALCCIVCPNGLIVWMDTRCPIHLYIYFRKYFGYQFHELRVEVDALHPVYENFIRRGKIFTPAGGCGWDGLLAFVYLEHVLSYAELGWADMTYW